MIAINYFAVIACAVLSIVLGFVWYGPLFGKKWMEFYGQKDITPEKMKEMQKEIRPLYFVQFLLTLLQLYVLAYYMALVPTVSGIEHAFWVWLGFIVPIVAGSGLWIGDTYKVMRQKFLIQGGYQLVFLLASGYILSVWK